MVMVRFASSDLSGRPWPAQDGTDFLALSSRGRMRHWPRTRMVCASMDRIGPHRESVCHALTSSTASGHAARHERWRDREREGGKL